MQAAVLAGVLPGINKIGKFPTAAARDWSFHLVVNPSFEAWRSAVGAAQTALRWQTVDPHAAVQGEE
jgi:hypothetical protein